MARFEVMTCSRSVHAFASFRKAFTYARNHSGTDGACRGSVLWRRRPFAGRKGGAGEVLVVCRNKICKRTGWMQGGR